MDDLSEKKQLSDSDGKQNLTTEEKVDAIVVEEIDRMYRHQRNPLNNMGGMDENNKLTLEERAFIKWYLMEYKPKKENQKQNL